MLIMTNVNDVHSKLWCVCLLVAAMGVLTLATDPWCPTACRCKRKDLNVDCSHSGFTVIPPDTPNDTVSLDLSANPLGQLTTFPNFRRLRILRITSHSLSEISADSFRALKQLRVLDLSDNFLETVPPNFVPTSLDTLILARNSLYWSKNETQPILQSQSLRTLDLSHCKIDDLPKSAFTSLHYLQHLDLSNNFITQLDPDIFSSLSALITLNISENHLTRFSRTIFQYNPFLSHLNLSYNPWGFKLIDPSNTSDIMIASTLPDASNIPILISLSLEELDFSGCWLRDLSPESLASLPKLRYLSLADINLRIIDPLAFHQLIHLESLDLSNNQFSYISENLFRYNTKLTSFTCSPCSYSFDFLSLFGSRNSFEFQSITYLNIKGTQVGGILHNMARFPNLITLQMSDTQISSISSTAFSLNHHLTEIDLSDCQIRKIPSTVFISNNKLDIIKLSGNFLGSNMLSTDRFPNTVATNLDLSNCKYRLIFKNYFSDLHSIVYLNLSSNPIFAIEDGAFLQMINLQSIDLSRAWLVNLDPQLFIKNTFLKSLFLSHIDLKKVISKSSFFNNNGTLIHFIQIPSLEELDLSNCDIQHLKKSMFSGTPNLHKLSLTSNGLRSMDVSIINDLSNLTFLDLQDNPWRCDCRLVQLRDWWFKMKMEPQKHWVICEEPEELHDRSWDAIDNCGSSMLQKNPNSSSQNISKEEEFLQSSEGKVLGKTSSTVTVNEESIVSTTRISKMFRTNGSTVIPITKTSYNESKKLTFPSNVTENYYLKYAKPLAIYRPSSKHIDNSLAVKNVLEGAALGFFGVVIILLIASVFFIIYRKRYRRLSSSISCETANSWEL